MKILNPIFIVGCGHSGNSLMLRILGTHPQIFAIPRETGLFCEKSPNKIKKAIEDCEYLCLQAKKKRFAEKTPRHIFCINSIYSQYPESKVILMLRDGRDVACSIKARTKDFNLAVDRWINDNLEGYKYWDNPNLKVVKYEDLISNSEKTLKKLMEFLGEDYTEKILKFYVKQEMWFDASEMVKPRKINNIQDHKNYRNWQVNQPLFDGRGRWRKEMELEEKRIFKRKAQEYLVEFGYVDYDNW